MDQELLGPVYAFQAFRYHPLSRGLWQDGTRLALGGRASALLEVFVSNSETPISAQTLHDAAWPGLYVEGSNLRAQIYNLRKLLGRHGNGTELIEAAAEGGYRLTVPVVLEAPPEGPAGVEAAG